MAYLLIIVVIIAANKFFNIGPWWHETGVYNAADLGNALIWMGVAFLLIRRKDNRVLNSSVSILIAVYLFVVSIQMGLAMINYDQSLLDVIIATRHQFYYGAFFLFVMLMDTPERIVRLFDYITALSIFAFVIGMVNYFGPTFIDNKFVEAELQRSGILRAFIPGMSIISFSAIWMSVRCTYSPRFSALKTTSFITLLGAHFFRQSRTRLVGVLVIVLGVLIAKRKYGILGIVIVFGTAGYVVAEYKLETNLVYNLFASAWEDVSEETGTWKPRVEQMEVDFREFQAHPIIGSGAVAIRAQTQGRQTKRESEYAEIAYQSDLGYTHWLKFYGLIGVIWLLLFFGSILLMSIKRVTNDNSTTSLIRTFCISYMSFVVISFVTLNHLMNPTGIVMVCLAMAALRRITFSDNAGRTTLRANTLSMGQPTSVGRAT